MQEKDNNKELLINEINRYHGKYSLILKNTEKDIPLINYLYNDILMKKILLENNYGILGNLLYNNKDKIDGEILAKMLIKDSQTDLNRIHAMYQFLETNKSLAQKILINKEDVKQIKEIFGSYILEYINPSLSHDKDFILELVMDNKNDGLSNFDILYYIIDDFKKDKKIVYHALKYHNLITKNTYQEKTLKDMYMELFQTIKQNNYFLDLEISILPNYLKNDVDLIKLILEVTYKFIPKNKEYTLKELYLEYMNSLRENEEQCIYGRKLYYTEDFSEELLNDQDFVLSIIEYDDDFDKEKIYERYGIQKVYEEIDIESQKLLEQYEESYQYRMKGKAYVKKYDFDAAICMFESGIEKYPYYHGCHVDKADCLVKLGKLDEAIEYLREIINKEELKNTNKKFYKICSNEYTYPNYTYKLFIKKLENKLLDTKKKKERGYVYRPKYKHFY